MWKCEYGSDNHHVRVVVSMGCCIEHPAGLFEKNYPSTTGDVLQMHAILFMSSDNRYRGARVERFIWSKVLPKPLADGTNYLYS